MAKEEKVIGKCALCGEENVVLELSHIIPKFVPRKLKKDSPSGKMRNPFSPNVPLQDGDKQYLLCGKCEDLFNEAETKFCKNVFLPFVDEQLKEFTYEKWLTDFIISVSWRTLYLELEGWKSDTSIRDSNREAFIRKEQVMREYLLDKRKDLYNIENHIFFFNEIEEIGGVEASNLNTFFKHGFFSYSVCWDEGCYIVTNLLGLVLVTIIKKSKKDTWRFTQVHKNGSFNTSTAQHITSMVFDDLFKYAAECDQAKENISQNQKDKILETIKKNPEKFLNSKIWEDIKRDSKL